MKKLFFGTLILGLVLVSPLPTMAEVNVDINISLPVPIVFVRPPELIVLPETYVYVVPDVDVEIFFYNGWWWRPWEGRWYRSRDYSSGWSYYPRVPSFYAEIPSNWRNDYQEHRWRGQQWDYQPIPHQQVQQNWQSWEENRHWEKQKNWGVQGLQRQQDQPQLEGVQPPRPEQDREINTQSQKAKPQPKAVKPPRPEQDREINTQSQKAKPHPKAVKPPRPEQHREINTQSQKAKPQQKAKAVKPQHQKADQKHKKAAKSQPAPQQQGKDAGEEEKHHGK